jgi:hypothetical protein
VRWLRGVLVAAAVLATACGDGSTEPVPSANAEEAKRFCDVLTDTSYTGNRGTERLRDVVPDALKDDFDKWRVNNDPDGAHKQRLNEYTHKACGVGFDEPGFTTTTAPTSTSATVAP